MIKVLLISVGLKVMFSCRIFYCEYVMMVETQLITVVNDSAGSIYQRFSENILILIPAQTL